MLTNTSVLIDEVIERKCSAALDGIATLLPRLESARATQDGGFGLRPCPNCD